MTNNQLGTWVATVGSSKAMEVVQSLQNRGTKQSKAEVHRDRTASLSGASMSKKDVNAALTLAGRRDGGPLSRSHSPLPLPSPSPPLPSLPGERACVRACACVCV